MAKKRRRRSSALCVCGSGESYAKCCGPYHRGEAIPETARELMRSRYSAYARGLVDYIVETTDPEGDAWQEPVVQWREEIAEFGRNMVFLGVEIVGGESDGDRATVTFLAKLERRGRDVSFEEKSQFVRRDGRWLYSCGEPLR